MYKVCIYNNNVETIVHYPVTDKEAPHIDKLPLKEGLSMVDSLSFVLYPNNPGYDKVFELTTKVKVIDTRDNSITFTGRILNIDEKMDSDGLFYKEILCEGALSYFNDTKVRQAIVVSNATDFLSLVLNNHNNKVESSKQVQLGNVDVAGDVSINGEFRTTLEVLLEAKEKLGGDIRVREADGILYLDWLKNFSSNNIDITLGVNMKDMVKGKDITSLGTRIIPLGANNLTIASVNDGLDYIEDVTAKSIYGVIEKIVEYRDIEDAIELYNACLVDLDKHTQPLYLLECNTVDLSYLSGNKTEQFVLGTNLHIDNPVMAIDSVYKIVQLELDLLKAYDPKLTIANFPMKLSTSINDLRKSTVSNNGVYNNVQVGDAFGIRAVRSDNKVITTLNATEGISIENQNEKVFSVDENGNIVANKGTYNDIQANRGTFDDITANRGIYNEITANNMVANEMKTSNTNNYVVFHDQYFDVYDRGFKRMTIGYIGDYPYIKFFNEEGQEGSISMSSVGTLFIESGRIESNSRVDFYGNTYYKGSEVATVDEFNSLQQRVAILEALGGA